MSLDRVYRTTTPTRKVGCHLRLDSLMDDTQYLAPRSTFIVLGALLGTQVGRDVEILNTFELTATSFDFRNATRSDQRAADVFVPVRPWIATMEWWLNQRSRYFRNDCGILKKRFRVSTRASRDRTGRNQNAQRWV